MEMRGKVKVEMDLKSSADQFYSFFRNTPHHLPNACTDVHAEEIHEGEWVSAGSVRKWTYSKENKAIIHIGVEGEVFKYYKSYKAIWQVVRRDGGLDITKMIIEYEKLNESMPHPVSYLDVMANMANDIDAHLVKA